jgi:chitodextrinase
VAGVTALPLIALTLVLPVPEVALAAPTTNLLAADMDVQFDTPASLLTPASSTTGGSQALVPGDTGSALELRDSSLGTNLSSAFYKRWSTSALRTRINQIYSQPVGSPAVAFTLSFDLRRSAASTKPVTKDVYAQIQFGNWDNVNVPRFPVPSTSIATTAAYTDTSGTLHPVSESDIASYRFTIVPNGGVRTVSTVELDFSVRVDTGGTDEAYIIDNPAVYEVGVSNDTTPPTAPGNVTKTGASASSVSLSWAASSDNVGVTGYDVLRDGLVATSVGGTVTSAVVTSLTPQTSYHFSVVAKDSAGNRSAESTAVVASTTVDTSLTPAPYPGTIATRKQWLWDKAKAMKEESGPINTTQYVTQLADGQNVASNLSKLDTMFQQYDAEQYKTVAKMYAYLMVGNQFDAAMLAHVKAYFAKYAYTKLVQTENLRMSNYVVGYLVGQHLPNVTDLNGNSAATLKAMNKVNIETMIDAGVHKGWAEYESPEYTFMTYFGLNAIYQWSDEPDLRQKAKMAMDVMWFEWGNDWNNGFPVSSMSRAKGDSATVSDPSWRGTDHTALSWAYFGADRAQQGIGESDNLAPALYRPYLEYLGLAVWRGMTYTPPQLAVEIGQQTAKNLTWNKTNGQNSGGHAMSIYRQAYVKPNWGLATEVQYRRVDNWIEDMPMSLRWRSASANGQFRVSADQGTTTVGTYNQPANQRVMQAGAAAVAVYKSAGGTTMNYLNAMFPDTGSIVQRVEQNGWVFVDTGSMYFAFKMLQPYQWYHQTPSDPSNKIKTTAQSHPSNGLTYSYDVLRSQADQNGWILQTADHADYPNLAGFTQAIQQTTVVDASHLSEVNPRLVYTALNGDVLDITFDNAAAAPAGAQKVNGTAIPFDTFKTFDTPWLQQGAGANAFVAKFNGGQVVYNFDNWTITGKCATPAPQPGPACPPR